MTRRLLTTCILLLVLAAAVFAWDPPTEIPNDSYFPILEFGDQNGFLLTTGIKGMGSSVLATRYGFFGVDLGAAVSAGNDTFGFNNIGRYATFLDDDLKNEIIELAGNDGIFVTPMMTAGPKLQIWRLGLSMQAVVNGQGYLTKDLLELILKGNDLNRTYNLDPNLRLSAVADLKAQLAFGVPLLAKVFRFKDVSLGVAYHIIPVGVYVVADSNVTLEAIYTEDDAEIDTQLSGDLYVSQSVRGSALDVGLMMRPTENLYLGVAIDGLQGKLTWNNFRWIDLRDLEDQDLEDIDWAEAGTPVAGEVTQKLPVTIKLGARYDLRRWLKFYGEARHITLANDDSYFTVSGGTDITLLWLLPLKASVTYDARYGRVGYNFGAGLKLLSVEANVEAYTKPHQSGDEIGLKIGARVAF